MTRATSSRITAGKLVREKIVSDVHARLAGGDDHECGSKIRAHRTGQHSKQVHRIEINLVPGSAADSDAVSAEGRAKGPVVRCTREERSRRGSGCLAWRRVFSVASGL